MTVATPAMLDRVLGVPEVLDPASPYWYFNTRNFNHVRNLWKVLLDLDRTAPNIISVDTETGGLDPQKDPIHFVQLKHPAFPTIIIDCRGGDRGNLKALGAALEVLLGYSRHLKVGHNLAFDWRFLKAKLGIEMVRMYDTMLGELVVNAGLWRQNPSLKELAEIYLGIEMDKSTRLDFLTMTVETEITEEQLRYMAADVEVIQPIVRHQWKRMDEEGLRDVVRLEMELMPALAESMLHGILIDTVLWREQLAKIEQTRREKEEELRVALQPYVDRHRELRAEPGQHEYLSLGSVEAAKVAQMAAAQAIYDKCFEKTQSRGDARKAFNAYKREHPIPKETMFGPLNLASNDQLSGALIQMGVPLPLTDKGGYSTDSEKLELLVPEYPVLRILLDWKTAQKNITSFGENVLKFVDDAGRIHPDINQCVRTGRMSIGKPPLQQMPSTDLRKCFRAGSGRLLVTADYSQIELRILAELTGEPALIQAFEEGLDLHSLTVRTMFPDLAHKSLEAIKEEHKEERHAAKTINFATVYGISAYALAVQLKTTVQKAQEYLDRWREAHPAVVEWMDRTARRGLLDGFSMTLDGRKRFFPPLGPEPRERGSVEWREWQSKRGSYTRMLCNFPVQGTSAGVTKAAICRIRKRLRAEGWHAVQVLYVHDEIVTEVADYQAEDVARIVHDEMVAAGEQWITTVPVTVEYKISQVWEK